MDLTQLLTGDFWLGFAGPMVVTAIFAQVFKYYWAKIFKTKPIKDWAAVPFGVFAGAICAIAYEMYQAGTLADHPFNWLVIPQLTAVYATASVFIYRHFLKKYIEDKTSQQVPRA